jgi:F0F1-type ATP synthase membrane subunit b/b'
VGPQQVPPEAAHGEHEAAAREDRPGAGGRREGARDEAERLRAAALEKAGKDAERLIEEGRGLLALERQEMEKAVQGLSLQLSGRILESVVEGLFTESEKARIISRGLERIRKVGGS